MKMREDNMFGDNNKLYTKEDISKVAVNLYLDGFPIMISALKVTISYKTQYILNILGELLQRCNAISVIMSSSEQTVTDEQYQDFAVVIGKTEELLEQVNLADLYK